MFPDVRRRSVLGISLFALFLPTSALGQEAASQAQADSLLALTEDLAEAWVALDAEEYLKWFSDDLAFYFEGGQADASDFEAGVRAAIGTLRSSTFEILNPRVDVLGADAAAVSFQLRELMVDTAGQTTDLRAALTLVWARRADGWKIVLAHESLPTPS